MDIFKGLVEITAPSALIGLAIPPARPLETRLGNGAISIILAFVTPLFQSETSRLSNIIMELAIATGLVFGIARGFNQPITLERVAKIQVSRALAAAAYVFVVYATVITAMAWEASSSK